MTSNCLEPWEEKAHRIIGLLARQAFERANKLPNGRLRKKHVPYTLPQLAIDLVFCLSKNDEISAKNLFLSYDGLKSI